MARGYVYEDDATGWRQMLASDLPNSGVGAGTYGDGTHVAQVTVNAQGLVTAAANVAISAGSGITALASPGGTITVTNPTGPTADIDLPATGVGAGTYGDSSHVARVTLDAEGRVTAASQVAIAGSGGGGFGLVKIFDQTLGAAAASIDTGAGGVTAGFVDLMIIAYARAADVANNVALNINFNNDSGANYDVSQWRNLDGSGASTNANARTAGIFGAIPASSATANYFSIVRGTIASYDSVTAGYKLVESVGGYNDAAGTLFQVGTLINTWRSTAAITRIAVSSAGGGNLITGSRLVIYGLQ